MTNKIHFFTHLGWSLKNSWDIPDKLIESRRETGHPLYTEDVFDILDDARENEETTFLLYSQLENTESYLDENGYSLTNFDHLVETVEESGRPTKSGQEYLKEELELIGNGKTAVLHGELYPGCARSVGLYIDDWTDWNIEEGVLYPRSGRYSWIR